MKQKKLTIEEMGKKLSEKSTWIRKGFKEFLEKWRCETYEELNDKSLGTKRFKHVRCECNMDYIYYLQRGSNVLYGTYEDYYSTGEVMDYAEFDIDTIDMVTLKTIILEIPEFLSGYAKRLQKKQVEYQGILDMIREKGETK
jgi:hypothetical protein